jgi:hypothetical protein
MGAKLQEELQKFAHVLENAGQDTATYGKTLSVATQQLSHGDMAQFKLVIEGVVAATRAIEAKHKVLENELKTSSSEIKSLRQRLESIREESRVDSLTGLLNRRGFDERMTMAVRGVAEDNDQLCLLIGDVDHFKKSTIYGACDRRLGCAWGPVLRPHQGGTRRPVTAARGIRRRAAEDLSKARSIAEHTASRSSRRIVKRRRARRWVRLRGRSAWRSMCPASRSPTHWAARMRASMPPNVRAAIA